MKRNNRSTVVTFEELNRIFQYFDSNDFAGLSCFLDVIAEQVREATPVVLTQSYPSSIRRIFLEITVILVHRVYDLGVDVDKVLGNVDPYSQIFSFENTPEIKQWFLDIASILYSALKDKEDRLDKNYMTMIDKIIEIHYTDADFNVSAIAKHLDLSIPYLSNYYKVHTGLNLKTVIINRRLDDGLELLQRTSMTINGIANKIGFASESYFCKVFKKNFNCTPSEYRKKLQ